MNWLGKTSKSAPFPLRKKNQFSIKNFFSKGGHVRIWPYLLKKSLMENFIFYSVVKAISPFFSMLYFTAVVLKRETMDKKWSKKYPTYLSSLEYRSIWLLIKLLFFFCRASVATQTTAIKAKYLMQLVICSKLRYLLQYSMHLQPQS